MENSNYYQPTYTGGVCPTCGKCPTCGSSGWYNTSTITWGNTNTNEDKNWDEIIEKLNEWRKNNEGK